MGSTSEIITHEMNLDGVFARVVRSSDGGPIRRIINGRRTGRTGTFISFKAGLRAMPWESIKGELPVLKLAEASTAVAGLLAQPHRLEIFTAEFERPLIYFPDLSVKADEQFLGGLEGRTPFVALAAGQRTHAEPLSRCRTAFIEVKVPGDPRLDDPAYNEKIRLAALVYERLGVTYRIIDQLDHFPMPRMLPFLDLYSFERHGKIDSGDVDILRRVFDNHRKARPYGEVADALGGGTLGRTKMLGLQLRRHLSIDLNRRITDDSCVLHVRTP